MLQIPLPEARIHSNLPGQDFSSIHAKRLNQLGVSLSQPTHLWLTGISRACVLELKPQWWGQESLPVELLVRTAIVIACIVTLPFTLLSIIFSLPMLAISNQWKGDFIYSKPANQHVPPATNKITMTSLNVMLMPNFISCINKQRPTSTRAHEVAEFLTKQGSDFICLQEAFEGCSSRVVKKALHQHGYNVINDIGSQTLGLNSGLMIASKYELNNVKFHKFPIASAADAFANKGIAIATAKVGEKNIVIANTHFQADGTDELPAVVARAAQSLMSQQLIQDYIKEAQERGERIDGVCVSGDTNISPFLPGKNGIQYNPEWQIANRLKKYNIQLIKDTKINKEELKKFKQLVLQIFNDIQQELSTQISSDNWVQEGGPFAQEMFAHGLNEGNISGSVVDMHANQQVGWGRECAVTPERVDFITVMIPDDKQLGKVSALKLEDVRLVRPLSAEGQLCGDHLAVQATLTIPNPLAVQAALAAGG